MSRTIKRNLSRAILFGIGFTTVVPLGAQLVPERSTLVAAKERRHRDLRIETTYESPAELPPQAAARAYEALAVLGVDVESARVDRRSGRFVTLLPSRPLLPGDGQGNRLRWADLDTTPPANAAALKHAAWNVFAGYLEAHREELRIDPGELAQPGRVTVHGGGEIVQIYAPRSFGGVPVRGSYLSAVVNHGNLVLFGAHRWGNRGASSNRPQLTPEEAIVVAEDYLSPLAVTGHWGKTHQVYLPMANGHAQAEIEHGKGYRYRLAWAVHLNVEADAGSWEVLVDARTGEILAAEDTTQDAEIKGGVSPVTNDGVWSLWRGGCGGSSGYMNYLAADDDNGNLNDGTPHMTAIYNAFNDQGLACPTPAVQDSGGTGIPTTAPSVNASAPGPDLTVDTVFLQEAVGQSDVCPVDPGEGEILWRQIALKSSSGSSPDGPCPTVPGWQVEQLFTGSSVPDKMKDFCVYTYSGQITDNDLYVDIDSCVTDADLRTLKSNLSCAQPDRMALSPASGSGTGDLASALLETLQGQFIENAGGLPSAITGPSPSVRLALLDTAPTMSENPKCMLTDSCSCVERCPQPNDFSPHGPTLGALADALLCSGIATCGVQVTSQLALSYKYECGEFDPQCPPPSSSDGYVGTISELATAIWEELGSTEDHLILNLSLGWHPRFGGYEEDEDNMPLDVRAVYFAIQEAVKNGALVIAAAGNKYDETGRNNSGPLLPAAWESRSSCATGDKACEKDYRPLVYAAAGIDRNGAPLSNARPESTPPRVAYGDHAAVEVVDASATPPVVPQSATLTGSSVAALVVSAAAAAAWGSDGDLSAAEVMARVYSTGIDVDRSADFCLDTLNVSPDCVDARRVSVCRAHHNCTGRGCGACDLDPQYPPVDFSSITFYPGDYDEWVEESPAERYPGLWAEPWICPQPASNLCPNCSVGQTAVDSQWTLYGEIEKIDGFYGNYSENQLTDLTLTCDGNSHKLVLDHFTRPFKVIFCDLECNPLNGNLKLSARFGNQELSLSAPVYVIPDFVADTAH